MLSYPLGENGSMFGGNDVQCCDAEEKDEEGEEEDDGDGDGDGEQRF